MSSSTSRSATNPSRISARIPCISVRIPCISVRRSVKPTRTPSLNRQVRKVLKTKGHLPTEEAALKLVYLNIQNARRWSRAPPYWRTAQQQFAIYFEDRLPQRGVN